MQNMSEDIQNKIDSLIESFDDYQKSYKKTVRWAWGVIITDIVAATVSISSGVIWLIQGKWFFGVTMLIFFWVHIYLLIDCVCGKERRGADFRELKLKHEATIQYLKRLKEDGWVEFIHYGHSGFDKNLFRPPVNHRFTHTKPDG